MNDQERHYYKIGEYYNVGGVKRKLIRFVNCNSKSSSVCSMDTLKGHICQGFKIFEDLEYTQCGINSNHNPIFLIKKWEEPKLELGKFKLVWEEPKKENKMNECVGSFDGHYKLGEFYKMHNEKYKLVAFKECETSKRYCDCREKCIGQKNFKNEKNKIINNICGHSESIGITVPLWKEPKLEFDLLTAFELAATKYEKLLECKNNTFVKGWLDAKAMEYGMKKFIAHCPLCTYFQFINSDSELKSKNGGCSTCSEYCKNLTVSKIGNDNISYNCYRVWSNQENLTKQEIQIFAAEFRRVAIKLKEKQATGE